MPDPPASVYDASTDPYKTGINNGEKRPTYKGTKTLELSPDGNWAWDNAQWIPRSKENNVIVADIDAERAKQGIPPLDPNNPETWWNPDKQQYGGWDD